MIYRETYFMEFDLTFSRDSGMQSLISRMIIIQLLMNRRYQYIIILTLERACFHNWM